MRTAGESIGGSLRASIERDDPMNQKRHNKDLYLKRTYGITIEQYELLCEGGCDICGKVPKEGQVGLNVDHDHATGYVRGVLCWLHNHKLVGQHRDGTLLRAAADYLDKPPAFDKIGQCKAPKKKRTAKRKSAKKV